MQLSNDDFQKLIREIDELRLGENISPRDAERRLLLILEKLLGVDGYELTLTRPEQDQGIDIIATHDSAFGKMRIGVQQKHYRRSNRVGVAEVRAALGAAVLGEYDKMLFVSNVPYTREALATVERDLPVRIELLDHDALRSWAERLRPIEQDVGMEVRNILTNVSREIARLIARDPMALDHIEWRDLERIVTEVFSEIGFNATLTPGSKDGGKDVILTCEVDGASHSYVVEIKHWRSRQLVGAKAVSDFLKVIVSEKRDGGLFLSTYGFHDNASEQLSEIQRTSLRFGDQTKIQSLYQTYLKMQSGIWEPPTSLPEVLFCETS